MADPELRCAAALGTRATKEENEAPVILVVADTRALVRSTPVNIASDRLAPSKFADVRFVPLRFAFVRFVATSTSTPATFEPAAVA